MEKKIKNIYLLPNVITAFALSCGLFVIFKINMTEVGELTFQSLLATTGILLLAAFADLLDGAVARAMKAESDFGGIFDTLADAISFGVAPSVIILKSLSLAQGSKLSFIVTICAIIYSLCGVLRLVRFNLSALHAKGNEELALANKKNFTGLPIPGAAAAAVSMNLLLTSGPPLLSPDVKAWVLSAVLAALGYFMVSRWKFPSIKTLQIKVSSFRAVFIIVIIAVMMFYGLLHEFPLTLFFLSWGYIALALALSIARLIAGKKSRTLEDFEPEEEEELEEEM